MLDKLDLFHNFPSQGKLTVVELFRPTDLTDEYVSWLNDPDVVRFSNQRFRRHNRLSCQAYFNSLKSSDSLFLVIRALETHVAIGTMTVHLSPQHGTADVGILIGNKACWGKGYGLDAWQSVLRSLSTEPTIRKVTAGTSLPNRGMINIMERSGMLYEATMKDQELINGKQTDLVFYARFH